MGKSTLKYIFLKKKFLCWICGNIFFWKNKTFIFYSSIFYENFDVFRINGLVLQLATLWASYKLSIYLAIFLSRSLSLSSSVSFSHIIHSLPLSVTQFVIVSSIVIYLYYLQWKYILICLCVCTEGSRYRSGSP